MKDLFQIKKQLENKEISSEELVTSYLDRITKNDGKINSFISVNEKVKEQARASDKKRAENRGENKLNQLGKLEGIPVAIKDLICTKGISTTAGSKILENFIPPYSATIVEKLESEGALILGKSNLDEFAMGSSNENSFFGPVKNPCNLDAVAGGSSGGSAACVAAGFAPIAIGTDTGGSIRQPAHFCGVVGLKPTYSRVSRYGIMAYASSMDQAGPMTLSVKDSALLLEILSGHDPKDGTTAKKSVPNWSGDINKSITGKKVGVFNYPENYVSSDTKEIYKKTIDTFKQSGAEVVEFDLDTEFKMSKFVVPTYYLIAMSEASSNLARYDGVRYGSRAQGTDLGSLYKKSRAEGFGEEVKRRIVLGTYALSAGYYEAFYLKACKVRRLIQNEMISLFNKCDVLLTPVSSSHAFKLDEKNHDPIKMYAEDIFTASANLSGLPAISVPGGISNTGMGEMPIGMQLIAPHYEEQRLFDFGTVIEDSTSFDIGKLNVL